MIEFDKNQIFNMMWILNNYEDLGKLLKFIEFNLIVRTIDS